MTKTPLRCKAQGRISARGFSRRHGRTCGRGPGRGRGHRLRAAGLHTNIPAAHRHPGRGAGRLQQGQRLQHTGAHQAPQRTGTQFRLRQGGQGAGHRLLVGKAYARLAQLGTGFVQFALCNALQGAGRKRAEHHALIQTRQKLGRKMPARALQRIVPGKQRLARAKAGGARRAAQRPGAQV